MSTLRSAATEFKQYQHWSQQGYTPLIKDPIAFFSAEWLAETFGMNVVIMIRHPAAFVSSIVKLGWEHPFNHFLEQELLMNKFLYPFTTEIKNFSTNKQEIIDQAILLWKMIHYVILKFQKEHSDWIYLRHEDISVDPLHTYRQLFQTLNLTFTPSVEEKIHEYSHPMNPQDPQAPVGSESTLRRNSQLNIKNWEKRLSTNDVKKIRNSVEDISRFFYSNEDW